MDDEEILDLYFDRSELAIQETDRKYGPYCYKIAIHILSNPADAEESVNDTYYLAWKLIPLRRPQRFSPCLGKLTRNLSIDRWRKNTAQKRGGGETQLLLDELAECVAGSESPETEFMRKELRAALNRFLCGLPERERAIFLFRYYYALTKEEIAQKNRVVCQSSKVHSAKNQKKISGSASKGET